SAAVWRNTLSTYGLPREPAGWKPAPASKRLTCFAVSCRYQEVKPEISPMQTAPTMTAEDLLRSAFKYQDALVSYAYGLLQDWALAQDAVQEAFIVLQKKHAEFHPGAGVFAWVRQMVRFEALSILRSRQRESCLADDELFSLVDQQFDRYFEQDGVGALESQKTALQH